MSKDPSESRPAGAKVTRNAAAQMLGRFVYLLTRVALPPITLRYVSLDEYGIWSTCFLIIGYIGIGTFGVSNVYIRFAAEYNATGRQREIGNLLGVGLAITLAFSAVVLAALWACLPWLDERFKVPIDLRPVAEMLILGTVATMLLDMTFGAYAYVLLGLQRITQQTAVWLASCLLETGVMVVLLMQGFGVYGLLMGFAARYVFSTLLYAVLCYRAVPGLKLTLRGGGSREKLRLFAGYGGILQLSGMFSIFLYSFERFCAGMLTGVGAVGLLDIGQKFPMMASQLFGSAGNSFLSALTHLHAQGRHDEIVKIYAQGTRYLNLLNGLAMGFIAPFGTYLIAAWMGADPAYGEAAAIMAWAALGYHLNIVTGPATTFYQGTHRPWRPLLGFSVPQLLLAGLGLLWAMAELGETVLAVVAAMAGARALSSLAFLMQANRSLGYSQGRFLWFVLLPGLAPYGLGYAFEWAARPWLSSLGTARIDLIPALAAAGLGYVAFVAVVLWGVFATREERAMLRRKLGRRG